MNSYVRNCDKNVLKLAVGFGQGRVHAGFPKKRKLSIGGFDSLPLSKLPG
jgi:hypothetical protein